MGIGAAAGGPEAVAMVTGMPCLGIGIAAAEAFGAASTVGVPGLRLKHLYTRDWNSIK